MLNFSGSNWLAARARKTPLMVAVVIAAILLAAAAVYAGCCIIDGMMPPDGGKIVQHDGDGLIYVYRVSRGPAGLPLSVSVNKTPWVTITKKAGQYLISDPRGTGDTVITLPAPTR
jgi:hypothetical protein